MPMSYYDTLCVPHIVNQQAYDGFRHCIQTKFNADPDSRWYGGYVAYEWEHLRHALSALPFSLEGKETLEFGCNIGASAIILAHIGAKVTAIDVNNNAINATSLNVAAYGKESHVKAYHFPDTRKLPFKDNQFDLILANSVLEYVPYNQIDSVLSELKRILKPNGIFMIVGTANRLSPCEVHSKRWLVNYMPRFVDRILGYDWQRGLSPWTLLHSFKEYKFLEHNDYSKSYLEIRKKFGWSKRKCTIIRFLAYILFPFGLAPSLLTPSITATFQKKFLKNFN
jgi:2-polyprenyl-3-methyl-5-hydroxy-6-metoxy-1,4-benzoquinol methylase